MSGYGYLDEIVEERRTLDPNRYAHAVRLLEDEIYRVRGGNEGPATYKEEVVKLSEKIMLPITEFPNFNFVGRLLGPKGSIMKGIAESTKTKISILGRGSTRDKEKEEELSESEDPKHAHFKEALHVLIQVEAPKSECHIRLADALEEIKAVLLPGDDMGYEKPMEDMGGMRGYNKGSNRRNMNRGSYGHGNRFESPRAGGSNTQEYEEERYRYDDFSEQRGSFKQSEIRNASNGGYQQKKFREDIYDEPRGRDAYYDDVSRY